MKKILIPVFIIIIAIVLVGIIISLSIPQHSYPEFQPGIFDAPVIETPHGWMGSMLSYPFMFEFNTNDSVGFDSVYRKFYRPTFVLSRNNTGIMSINITSYSNNNSTEVSLLRIGYLQSRDITAELIPESVNLSPNETRTVRLKITASSTTPLSEPGNSDDENNTVVVWLTSEEWRIGQAFFLRIVE
jgi:hypothetical protein